MKIIGSIILGFAAAGLFAGSAYSGAEQTLLLVSGAGSDPSRFVIQGSGGSHVVEAHATYVRTEDGERIVELVSPATIALSTQAVFTIRFQTVEGSAPVHVTVSGSKVAGADRIKMEGRVIELARREVGGPVEVLRSDAIRVGTEPN